MSGSVAHLGLHENLLVQSQAVYCSYSENFTVQVPRCGLGIIEIFFIKKRFQKRTSTGLRYFGNAVVCWSLAFSSRGSIGCKGSAYIPVFRETFTRRKRKSRTFWHLSSSSFIHELQSTFLTANCGGRSMQPRPWRHLSR